MAQPLIIRGIAAPYGIEAIIADDVTELIGPGAFTQQCKHQLNCGLKLDTHDSCAQDVAHTSNDTLFLFEGKQGLFFEARIKPDIANFGLICWEISNRKYARCSVHFSRRLAHTRSDGTEHVSFAELDHIALTNHATYGGFTACWIANRYPAPTDSRLVLAAEQWDKAYRRHRAIHVVRSVRAKAKRILTRTATPPPAAHITRSKFVRMSAGEIASERKFAKLLQLNGSPSAMLLREIVLERLRRHERNRRW